jgi:hypothetical protein
VASHFRVLTYGVDVVTVWSAPAIGLWGARRPIGNSRCRPIASNWIRLSWQPDAVRENWTGGAFEPEPDKSWTNL